MAYIGVSPNAGTVATQIITSANGSATSFTLDQTVPDGQSIIVLVGNVVQQPTHNGITGAYSASGNTITFTGAPANGDNIIIRYLGRSVDVATNYKKVIRYRYVATNAQTTFTGADSNGLTLSYTAEDIDVFLNGVRLDQTDYTATNGTSVVLGSGATTSDELVILAYNTVQLADTVPASTGGTFTGATTHNGGIATTTLTASGNITGTLATASQPNITSVGTLTGFTSTGIDDNADATAITIDSSEDVTLSGHLASGVNKNIDVRDADGHVSGRLRNVSGSNNALTIEADPDNSASGSYVSFKVDTSEKMKITDTGNVGIGASPESAVKLEVNAGSDGAVAISGRSDGGNGNNRRFNLIPYSSGGTYGGGLKIQTRNTSNVFGNAIEYTNSKQEVFHGNYRTADVPNQFSNHKHFYTGTEYSTFSNAGSGVANAQTMTTNLAYQGMQIVCVKVYYNSDSALMHETFATICNQYHNSGIAIQHAHNGTGIIDSVSLSLTGGYSTRRLVVTLDPATGYTGNNYTYIVHYGYTLN